MSRGYLTANCTMVPSTSSYMVPLTLEAGVVEPRRPNAAAPGTRDVGPRQHREDVPATRVRLVVGQHRQLALEPARGHERLLLQSSSLNCHEGTWSQIILTPSAPRTRFFARHIQFRGNCTAVRKHHPDG